MGKRVYPYKYINCWEKFKENWLPCRDAFYSKLNLGEISEKDYEHARAAWNHFVMKTLSKYGNRYLQIYAVLLSDVCKTFRNVCLENNGLDPGHFHPSPSLADMHEQNRYLVGIIKQSTYAAYVQERNSSCPSIYQG